MPSIWFGNLGSTPENDDLSITGGLYFLATEESKSAVVFDFRKYEKKSSSEDWRMSYQRFTETLRVPILQQSQLQLLMEMPSPLCCDAVFKEVLANIEKVYVVGLSKQPPFSYGWAHLYKLFSKRPLHISKVLPGTSQWALRRETESTQCILREIAATGISECGEKADIDPFQLFVFRNKATDESASALVVGESQGSPFSLFFGGREFKYQLPSHRTRDRLRVRDMKLHILSAQTWHAFYP